MRISRQRRARLRAEILLANAIKLSQLAWPFATLTVQHDAIEANLSGIAPTADIRLLEKEIRQLEQNENTPYICDRARFEHMLDKNDRRRAELEKELAELRRQSDLSIAANLAAERARAF